MKTDMLIMKNFFRSYLEKYGGKIKPVTLNISANKATNSPAMVSGTLKWYAIRGITPPILKKVDSEKAIKNNPKVIFLVISSPSLYKIEYIIYFY